MHIEGFRLWWEANQSSKRVYYHFHSENDDFTNISIFFAEPVCKGVMVIVWTVLAIAFWIALLTGALIMNSTIIAISLIGFILNLVTHISFQTVWSIKLFSDSDYMIVALGMIGFLIMVICMDIYYAWVLGSFCHELRNGQYGSALPYRN